MMLTRSWLILAFISLIAFNGKGKENPGWHTQLASAITSKIKKQILRNASQTARGESRLNSYIIELGGPDDYRLQRTWVDERGTVKQKIFDDATIEGFDAELKEINNLEPWSSKNKALYTVIINDWKLLMNNTISLDGPISNLNVFAKNGDAKSYDSLRIKMDLLPMAIRDEVRENHPELQNVVIYLVARFRTYNDPDELKKGVRAHRYYYSSFSDATLAQKLLTVTNIKQLNADGLIQANLKIIKEEANKSSSTTVTLAQHYNVPKGETQLLASALKQPVRIIVEAPDDPATSVYDYSNLIPKEETLKVINKLCSDLRQNNGANGILLKVFHTDYRVDKSTIMKIQQYVDNMARNDIAIWLHLNDENVVQYDIYFGPDLQSRLTKDYFDHLKDFVSISIQYAHLQTVPYVKSAIFFAEQLSKLIGMVVIEPRFYDPALPDYDPGIFLAYYAGRTGADAGLSLIFQTMKSADESFIDKVKNGAWADCQEKQYEFALISGLWNGVVTEVKGLPDVAKFLGDAYSDPPTMAQVNGVINAIFINGQAYDAIVGQLKNRYSTQQYSDFAILHHSASDLVSTAVMFIGVGELTGAAKASEIFAKISAVANFIDFVSISRYVVGTVRGLTIYKLAMSNARYFFTLAKLEAKTLIKIVNATGDILKNTDLSLLRQIEVETGGGIKTTIWVDPAEVFKQTIVPMKQVVKDAYGNRILEYTDELGEKHIIVEANDASKLVDDAGELTTLLQKIEAKLPTDELKAAFRADFSDNIEMLRRFDGEEGLVDSWKVLKDADVDDAIRKGTNGELDVVRKYMDDFPDRDVTKEIVEVGGFQDWEIANLLKSYNYSLFEQIDGTLFIRDPNGRVGKILDKSKINDITWFSPQAGSTWQIHQLNSTNYLKFKYGDNVYQQLKVKIYHLSGSTLDCYLDDVVECADSRFIISDAKHSQKAAIVDGQIPGYTVNQTQGYQWIVDGQVTKIEVIGDKGLPNITRQTDLLPRLDGKIRILSNNATGEIVESSILRTQ